MAWPAAIEDGGAATLPQKALPFAELPWPAVGRSVAVRLPDHPGSIDNPQLATRAERQIP